MGPTSLGRRMKYAVISSEENMADLKKYQDISRQLSLARSLSESEAKILAKEGKVIVWIDKSIEEKAKKKLVSYTVYSFLFTVYEVCAHSL